MDGRFEGLERVRAGIDIGRRHDQPTVVAVGLAQIGSGCGEMRRYDEAIPALVEGVATPPRTTSELAGSMPSHGWPDAASTSASGTRPRPHARMS